MNGIQGWAANSSMWVPKPSHGWPLAFTIRLTRHGQGSDTLFNHNGLLASSSTHSGGGIPNSISVRFVAVPGWPLFHATSLDGLCWQGVVAAGGVVWWVVVVVVWWVAMVWW